MIWVIVVTIVIVVTDYESVNTYLNIITDDRGIEKVRWKLVHIFWENFQLYDHFLINNAL